MTDKTVVLYVDDEQNNLTAFKAYFRTNYIVLTAKSAEEGLGILKVVSPHIIVADQKMPGTTGVEFIEQASKKFIEPIKIVVSAHRDTTAIEKAFEEGKIYKFHIKPWDFTELENTMNEGLRLMKEVKWK